MFRMISGVVTRRGWVVLLVVALVVAALEIVSPPWSTVSRDDDVRFFPSEYPSVVGLGLLERGFPQNVSDSAVALIVERSDGPLTFADFNFLDRMTRAVRALKDQQVVSRSPGAAAAPVTLSIKEVSDRRAPVEGERYRARNSLGGEIALAVVKLSSTYISKQSRVTVDKILEVVEDYRPMADPGLRVGLTGSAAVGHDSNVAANHSIEATTTATILLVVAILLVVYRSPLLAFIPLVTIALSAWASLNLIAWLANPPVNFQVINVTQVFVVVILYGAGTDYCLFLIARYREELARGRTRPEALREAIEQVGGALVASAGTVILGLGMLWFSTFAKVRYSGPAIALSLAIGLAAALTLAPVLLDLLRGAVFWPFRPPHHTPGRDREAESLQETPMFGFWGRVGDLVVRRPGTILLVSVLAMVPLAIVGMRSKVNYDLLSDLQHDAPSVRGAALLKGYYPAGDLGPSTVLVSAPKVDFTTEEGRQVVARLSRMIKGLAHVAEVRSLTRPLGKPGQYVPPEDGPAPVAAAPSAPPPRRPGLLGSLGLDQLGQQASRTIEDVKLRAILSGIRDRYVSTEAKLPADRNRITRLDVIFDVTPFSEAALDSLDAVERAVKAEVARGGLLEGATVGLAGTTVQIGDLKRVTTADQRRMYVLVTLGVYAILVVLLRRPLICLYLIVTVIFGYLATLGLTELVFRGLHPPGTPFEGLDWKVSFFLFVILVAVGEDYNIFLMSRVIEEERLHGPIEGTRRAVAHTGGIISSCGVIMAGTFLAMLFGSLTTLKQLGFALGVGVLLDTFIVRPVLVPAFVVLYHRWRPGVTLDDAAVGHAPSPIDSDEHAEAVEESNGNGKGEPGHPLSVPRPAVMKKPAGRHDS